MNGTHPVPATDQPSLERSLAGLMAEYLSPDDLVEMVERLERQAVSWTGAEAIPWRQRLGALKQVVMDARVSAAAESEKLFWTLAYVAVVLLHGSLIAVNVAAFLVAPWLAPWYLAFPACFAILWSVCSSYECPITRWENQVRRRLGWPLIRGFVGHYFIRPFRRWRRSFLKSRSPGSPLGSSCPPVVHCD